MAELRLSDDEIRGCGVGMGERCCAYLLVGEHGFECGRATELAAALRARAKVGAMTARRTPTVPYPRCQTESER